MSTETPSAKSMVDDVRRRQLLEAATRIFLRFGFRKASMDEVAKAAGISRQGLYLHFATKEELFRAALEHVLEAAFDTAATAISATDDDIEERLVRAFDAWLGRFAGSHGDDASDLGETSRALVGNMFEEREARFIEVVTKAVRGSGLVAAYKSVGLTARQITDILYATARGLKHTSASREAFVHGFTLAARAMCMPLRSAQ